MSGASLVRCEDKLISKESNTKNLCLYLAGALFLICLMGNVSAGIMDASSSSYSIGSYQTGLNAEESSSDNYNARHLTAYQQTGDDEASSTIYNLNVGSFGLFGIAQTPCDFSGEVLINSLSAVVGTVISAYDSQGNNCGNFTVVAEGYYGPLHCSLDNTGTAVDEGADEGENITFKIYGTEAIATGNITCSSGVAQDVDLTTTLNLTLISPLNSSITNNASSYEWLYSDDSTTNYTLLIDNNSDFSSAEKNVSDIETLSYSSISSLADGTYYWKVQVFDNQVFDSETGVWQFTLDTEKPSATNMQVQPSQINVSQYVNITATITDNLEVDIATIQMTDPLGAIVNYTMSNSSSSYNLTYQAMIAGIYNISLIVNDTAGNINDTAADTLEAFQVDGLSIVITSPSDGIIKNTNESFLTNATVSSYGFDLTSCNATISFSNKSIANLSSGENYTIDLGNMSAGNSTYINWNVSTSNFSAYVNITADAECVGWNASNTITLRVQERSACTANITLYSTPQNLNLISLPCEPENTTLASVMTSVSGNYSAVYAYDSTDSSNPWRTSFTSRSEKFNDLKNMTSTKGYWVKMSSNDTLENNGTILEVTEVSLYASPQSLNLIGYPSLGMKSISNALSGISNGYVAIYSYDSTDASNPWRTSFASRSEKFNDLKNMSSTKGYWIKMGSDRTLEVNRDEN